MLRIITDTPEFFSDLGDVLRLFYGDIQISLTDGETVFEHRFTEAEGRWIDRWSGEGRESVLEQPAFTGTPVEVKRLRKRQVKLALYNLLKALTGVRPPWGSLTGIRPTRLLYEAIEAGLSLEDAVQNVQTAYDVSPDRAALLGEIARMQAGIREAPANQFDLYIGIPFCKTRCSYCSFSAGEIGDGRRVAPYVDALLRDGEKLKMLKDRGIGRISVNPQTFNDETLKRIGRAHTGAETLEAYALARKLGFDDINMDLIAALPGETVADFRHTLDVVEGLRPESVTVHSLAIKRSSKLHEQLTVAGGHTQTNAVGAAEMIATARSRLMGQGYRPYYLYRQKYMAGNLENVGYALPGKACLYNIGNMEETVSVLALGAGAISKWLFDRTLRIERAPNVRNIDEYIARVDEMVRRKRSVILSGEVGR